MVEDNDRVERRSGVPDRRVSETDRRGNDRVINEESPRRKNSGRRTQDK